MRLHRSAVVCLAAAAVASAAGCSGSATPSPQPSPTPSSPPTARPGQAQTVTKSELVTLDATASSDPDGAPLSYRWTQVAGPAVTLSDPAAARPSFTAPRASCTLAFSLVVGDGKADSSPASVTVTVTDRAPVASSGTAALTTGGGHVVMLDGRGSWDPDGDALAYSWRQTGGDVAVAVQDWPDGTATFTAPVAAAPLTLSFALTVDDGELTSSTATVSVLVLPPGTTLPPTVSAGPDQTVARRSSVVLYGSASNLQSLSLSVKWTQVDGPAVTLSVSPYAWYPTASFTAPEVECDLTFRLTADDGVASASDDVVVHVVNLAPMIASVSLSPSAPTTVDALAASAVVSDPDGDAVSLAYAWKRNGVAIAGATAPTLAARQAVRGDAVMVIVTASDGKLSTTAQASVTIADAPPSLTAASAPARVTYGQTVSFQVTASDPDGDPVGDLALEYGPAGMTVTPGGLVTWTAAAPMFDRAQDFRWSVVTNGAPTGRLTGTTTVEDPRREYPLRRGGLRLPASRAGLRVRDLDGDGVAEVLVVGAEGVYELARSGGGYVQRWMYPFAPGAESVQAIAAGDVDGDGKQEIFFAAGTLLVELDGASRREVARYDTAPSSCVDLALADVDLDGRSELVCLAAASNYWDSTAQVMVLDARSLALEWSTAALALGSSVAVGNVDGDPALEIVTSGGFVFDGKTQANEWAYGPGFGDVVDVGDLDGTGVAQIVGMRSRGNFNGFSAVYKAPLWEASRFNPGALRVADLDGDGKAEVLVGDAQWGSVTAYRYDAAKNTVAVALDLVGIFSSGSYDQVVAIDVGDVDGDGAREIVFGAGGVGVGGTALAIAGSSAPAKLEWASAIPVLDHPFIGARPARTTASGPTVLLYAAPSTNSTYGGTRLVALDPGTGLVQVSKEVGSNWNHRAALDVADYDGDGVDEALLATANLYDGYFVAYDFARDVVEWTSGTGGGTYGGLGTGVAVAHADLNGDGFDDLVVITGDGHVYAYDVKNQALIWKSTAVDPSGGNGVDVAVADVDGDGAPEIVAVGSTRAVVYRKAPAPIGYVEAATAAVTGALDLVVADCDGDGKAEIYVLASGGYGSGPTSVTRLDGALQAVGSFTLDGPALSLHVEELGPGHKNLLVGMGSSYSYYPYTTASSYLRAVDARTGAEVWRSPPLWGAVSPNSLSYVDLAGDGRRAIAFATASGMYVTR